MNSRNNGSRPLDPYEAQYQQLLEQFSRLAGDTDGEVDLNPGSIDDAFAGYEQQYAQQSLLQRDYGAPHGMAGYGRPQQDYGGEYGDMYGRNRQSYDGRGTQHREQQSGRSQQNYGGEYGDMYGRSRQSYDGRSTHHREQQSGRSQQDRGGEYGDMYGRSRQSYDGRSTHHREQQSGRSQQDHRPAGQRTEPNRRPQKNKKSASDRRRPQNDRDERGQLQFGSHSKGQTHAKRHPIQRFFSTLIVFLLIIFLGMNILLYSYVCMVNQRGRGERAVTGASMNSADVTNILLIGSDTRSPDEFGRTDSMILLSVNSSKKTVTMTSFMRDMYVEITGYDHNGEKIDTWDKLNSAYVYGGAELLMDTIEHNFDIAVDDYVYVDFFAFIDIVDSIGGIEVDVSDEEAAGMEDPQREQNKYLEQDSDTDLLTHGGKLNLNGNQALAYARLRYVGNADFERTERQREVIGKIIDKVKGSNPLVMNRFAKTTLSKLSTNMSRADMMLTAYKAVFSLNYTVRSLRIPEEGVYSFGWHGDQSTLDVDLDACRTLLRQELYG